LAGSRLGWAAGGIATDGSLGQALRLSGNQVVIPQALGQTTGVNLFHSFSTFNVAAGQMVTFTGDDALQAIISRVTGGEASAIDGVLRAQAGHADFYLINPAGIIFGPNAQVDVPAAFHASTADQLKLADGAIFSAMPSDSSQLSSAAPAAFGFLGASPLNNGLVAIKGAQLAVREGQVLDLAAGGISVENHANLSAPSGTIRLAALSGAGEAPVEHGSGEGAPAALENAGAITLHDSLANVSGNGGGRIVVQGGKVLHQGDSSLRNINTGDADATAAQGIYVQAQDLTLDGGALNAGTRTGTGDAANIDVQVAGKLTLRNNSLINTFSEGAGRAGDMAVRAEDILLQSRKDAIVSNSSSLGDGGNIYVRAAGALEIAGAIITEAFSSGNAGNLHVQAGSVNIDGRGDNASFHGILSYASRGSGAAGQVSVASSGGLKLAEGGEISSFTYFSTGDAGSVEVKAGSVLIDGRGGLSRTSIYSESRLGTGKPGAVSVEATGRMALLDGGTIANTSYLGDIDAGAVQVKAGALTIDGKTNQGITTGIFSGASQGAGNAGAISIASTGAIEILNGGRISSTTSGAGNANTVTLEAGSLSIDAQGRYFPITGIFSEADLGSTGQAGSLDLNIQGAVSVRGGGRISVVTAGAGAAGTLTLNAESIAIEGQGKGGSSGIYATALPGSSAQTGNIALAAARGIRLSNHALITTVSNSIADDPQAIVPGSLQISAPEISLDGSRITAASLGNTKAGDVTLKFDKLQCLNHSSIQTDSFNGDGGAIQLLGGELIFLSGSKILTTANGASSNGGDIRLASDVLVLETGLIQANANGGKGGNIDINVKALIPNGERLLLGGTQPIGDWTPDSFGYNIIQAASKARASGTINSTAPQLNLNGVLANFGGPQFDMGSIAQDYCALGNGSALTRQGRGGLPPRGHEALP
jgi:filamentous hemagglutinin family protein